MVYQEYNENESTIFDDDEYINDCSSLKRKMTILEKIAIIISSLLCFPMGIFFCNLIPGKLQSYIELAEMPQNILFLFTWLLSFFILMFSEFHEKNFSLYKGLIIPTLFSFVWSGLLICFTGSIIALIEKDGASLWFFIALFTALIYSILLLTPNLMLLFSSESPQ